MSQHGWDPKKTVISGRRGSDANYDIRTPASSHVNVRPSPSYYGRNFQNSAQGRSSSFAYGDIKEPKLPDPWVKVPQPYPERVEKEYLAYKDAGKHMTAVRREYNATGAMGVSGNQGPAMQILRQGERLATDMIAAANTVAASHSGFDHKYPTAYENLEKKGSHYDEAVKNLKTARNYRNQREVLRGKINAPPRP
ncbi:uncharacterized protein BO87DRAFT_454533 [Aspergillus neoniger CBS 115656]|uniref:Uncharacterized protein n=1 Tax=Aspergillus neoniger (strain CBS 115656) TaxID=1448310 RepID=A0A318Z478_ASPNB|nr:hypothetical protein BO87DRAFT_454533 [Aspergillus neoniger CBS 115656]PYH39713.1 hypothetical protein BO87DRAFT_454533 [Aspergillus neoniger CBS 115656]